MLFRLFHVVLLTLLGIGVGADDSMVEDEGGMATEEAKAAILAVLESQNMEQMRSAKMDVDHFLALLNAFNVRGFHFS